MPLVSVIIPTFNRARLIAQAVESVLLQTYSDLELIVVDDGSTDRTHVTLQPYAGHIRYFRQDNSGVSAARNRGILESGGELIAFLDSDDRWHKDKLKYQVELFKTHPDTAVCYTDEIWIRRGRLVNAKRKHAKYTGCIFENVLPLCIISPSSVMLRRSVLLDVGLFDETFPVCEDYDMWLRVALRYPVDFIPMPLTVKQGGHQDQLSSQHWGLDRFRVRALEKLLANDPLDTHQRASVLKQLVSRCTILSEGCLKRGKTDEWHHYRSASEKYRGELSETLQNVGRPSAEKAASLTDWGNAS